MITFDYLLLCEGAQEHDRKLYILGGDFNQLRVPQFPVTFRFSIVTRLSTEPGDANLTVGISAELIHESTGDVLSLFDGHFVLGDAPTNPPNVRHHQPMVIEMPDAMLKETGTYAATLRVEGREVQRTVLYVVDLT